MTMTHLPENATNNLEFLEAIEHVATTPTSTDDEVGRLHKPKFPAEPNRYALYVTAGCPFAARPWLVQALYGLPIQIIKLFPAAHDDGWFFIAKSQGEQDLVSNFPYANTLHKDPLHDDDNIDNDGDENNNRVVHHLFQLYQKVNPNFSGAYSVPLLWDTIQDTAVNNASLPLAEMLATQMKHLATRNMDIDLFPPIGTEEYQVHSALVQQLHSTITTAVYKINAIYNNGTRHDELVKEFYNTLTQFQNQLVDSTTSPGWLMGGNQLRFCDLVLFITLLRFDIAYQWRFGLGQYSIRHDYPGLWAFVQRVLTIPGISDAVFPRDIMAMYFMGTKWNANGQGRNVPLVPSAWEKDLSL